jgi:hypothetical protein
MLTQERVLSYIKDNLGFPFMQLELSDEKIVEYFTDHTRREFSYYVPDRSKIVIDVSTDAYKVPGRGNEFYLEDPDGIEILNVVDMYTDAGNLYLFGHPPLGALSHGELREWAYNVELAMETKMFSSFDYTFEFSPPNVVRISPQPVASLHNITFEYERQQPSDLGNVPNDLHLDFQKMALADIMMVIGRIRKRYGGGNLRTPFGEIPLEGDIYEEGKEMKREILEKLERLFVPNVRVDFG